ncbi:hypothetical protein BJF90_05580 [Pseudonocardia sp. CNS-004]|nr:hypothetical protein BJF90_05580 [Pseudonocardia sp. CNS-004]
MTDRVDRGLLAERAAAVVRHLDRVAEHLPADPDDLRPLTSATDTVVLHLWQAVQVVIDLAVSTCVRLGLGSPPTYGDAFRQLAEARSFRTLLPSVWGVPPASATSSCTAMDGSTSGGSTPSHRPARPI